MVDIYAISGSAVDVQGAIDSASFGDTVHIPEGTWDWVEIDADWITATIPVGINVVGATTTKDSDGMSVTWKTTLNMSWDVPATYDNQVWWFDKAGNGIDNDFVFSEIELRGYRYTDEDSVQWHDGLTMDNVAGFRIHHCYFNHTPGGGIASIGQYSHGVIDHCKFINKRANCTVNWADGDVGYGLQVGRGTGTTWWDDNIDNVHGKYTNYSTYVEDCIFEKWRHCIASNDGAHYVLRYSLIEYDHGFGSVDAHGTYTGVGTRAVELYENDFENCLLDWNRNVFRHRGGAAIIFDNRGDDSYSILDSMVNEGSVEKCWPNDTYIWDNTGVGTPVSLPRGSPPTEGENYFLYEKSNN